MICFKKISILLFLLFGITILYAEEFKGIHGFYLNDSKDKVFENAKKLGIFLNKKNENSYIGDSSSQEYAGYKVKEYYFVFWDDKLIRLEIRLKEVSDTSRQRIVSAIIDKYEFEQDLRYDRKFHIYSNFYNEIAFSYYEYANVWDWDDLGLGFVYIDKLAEYNDWVEKKEERDLYDSL